MIPVSQNWEQKNNSQVGWPSNKKNLDNKFNVLKNKFNMRCTPVYIVN